MAPRRTVSGTALLALVVTSLLAMSACSDDDDASTSGTVSDHADDSGDDSADLDTASGAGDGGTTPAPSDGGDPGGDTVTDVGDIDLVAAQIDRKIVYRGDITSEVDDVGSAVRSARDEVAAEGGYVFGQEITDGSARVVLKVPSGRFEAAFDAVARIGEVTSQKIEADDVSEQFTDLESRRATLEASIARLRGFLEGTTNVDEISRLESELTHREAERDVIAGQLRVLTDRTSFGTISVVFTVPEEVDAAAVEEDESRGPPGFGRGLEVGWDGVVFAAALAATVTGFLLPMLPVLLLVGGLAWWLRKRRQHEATRLADQPS